MERPSGKEELNNLQMRIRKEILESFLSLENTFLITKEKTLVVKSLTRDLDFGTRERRERKCKNLIGHGVP